MTSSCTRDSVWGNGLCTLLMSDIRCFVTSLIGINVPECCLFSGESCVVSEAIRRIPEELIARISG